MQKPHPSSPEPPALDFRNQPPFTKKQYQQTLQLKDSMQMRYASSIIEVISEDKLYKSRPSAEDSGIFCPIVEISDVVRYGDEENNLNSLEIEKNQEKSQVLAKLFKKKINPKKALKYSFTNLTALFKAVSNMPLKAVKDSFLALRLVPMPSLKKKQVSVLPPYKSRSSFHSGTTASTFRQQLRSRQRKLQIQQNRKEAASNITGWIQFKILMTEQMVLKRIAALPKIKAQRQFSPITGNKQSNTIIQNFYLSQYNQDNSLSLVPPAESSLAYTADNGFQFSIKENTATTPQKLSAQRLPSRGNPTQFYYQGLLSSPQISDCKESLVQQYRQHMSRKESAKKESRLQMKKSGQYRNNKNVNAAVPLKLNINQERRYLTIRTNTFELPLMNDVDARQKEKANCVNTLPIKSDRIVTSDPQVAHEQAEPIKNDLQTAFFIFQNRKSNKNYTSNASNQTNTSNSYFASVRQKYSKIMPSDSKHSNEEKITQTCRPRPKIFSPQSYETGLTATQQKRGPQKIENYYFPGRESNTRQNRLDQVKQVDSVLSQYKQLKKNPKDKPGRIEESQVHPLEIAQEPNIKPAKKSPSFAIKTDRTSANQLQIETSKLKSQKSIEPNDGYELRLISKINVPQGVSYRQQASVQLSSPRGTYNRKVQNIFSPQQARSNPYSPSPQYNRPSQDNLRSQLRPQQFGRPISRLPNHQGNTQNIYQLNQHEQHQRYGIDHNRPKSPHIAFSHENRLPNPALNYHQNTQRPASRLLSPQVGPSHQRPTFDYALASSREYSEKKNQYLSPQTKIDPYQMQTPVKFSHENFKQLKSGIAQPSYEYFNMSSLHKYGHMNKAAIFNNRYYTSAAERQPSIMADLHRQHQQQPLNRQYPQPSFTQRKPPQDRPHSSSRQSTERMNFFSIQSPLQSEINPNNGSLKNRFPSKIVRPKSMNEKIFITLRGGQ